MRSHRLSPSFPFLFLVCLGALALRGEEEPLLEPMKWENSSVCFSRKSNLSRKLLGTKKQRKHQRKKGRKKKSRRNLLLGGIFTSSGCRSSPSAWRGWRRRWSWGCPRPPSRPPCPWQCSWRLVRASPRLKHVEKDEIRLYNNSQSLFTAQVGLRNHSITNTPDRHAALVVTSRHQVT